MPPACTPEKQFDNRQNVSEEESPMLGYVTPPTNTNQNIKCSAREMQYVQYVIEKLPTLSKVFNLHKKIGEGTFSAVFMASLATDLSNEKLYAIKHLVPTTHPKRMEVELHCLKQIGGVDNVAGLDLCLRENENIVFVMPYLEHDHFIDYAHDVNKEEVALYVKNLLIAVRRVHSFDIIHRDIKPNNFLYNRKDKKFLLIDFGLAQICSTNTTSARQDESRKRKRQSDVEDTDKMEEAGPAAKRRALQMPIKNKTPQSVDKKQKLSSNNKSPKDHSNAPRCKCYGKPSVCNICLLRKGQEASRAGTPGFRPPEVLLKHADQTTAVDIWAVGIMMLCLLSGTYPFFRAPDDVTALAEMIAIFGDEAMKKLARLFGRHLSCSQKCPPLDLRKLCCKLRVRGKKNVNKSDVKCRNCGYFQHNCLCIGKPMEDIEDLFPDSAYDLLKRLLDINPYTRITAEEALHHPFLNS